MSSGTGALRTEMREIWLAPDHKMPYCLNKGAFFVTAINIDYGYI